MKNNQLKGWLYLLPALLFLGAFMIYPLVDVVVYSFEEGYNSASQTFFGTGLYNYSYVLHDPYFLQAVKNTFILVIITVPISTGLGLLISLGLNSIKKLKELYQTVFFLPYVTNTLAVGLVFMILFKKTAYTDGMVNLLIHFAFFVIVSTKRKDHKDNCIIFHCIILEGFYSVFLILLCVFLDFLIEHFHLRFRILIIGIML